ncbi:MAG: polysaccharide deacetylase family protein [Rhizomicrobium sp.]
MKRFVLAMLICVVASPASAVQIALTFDDLPSHSALPPGQTRVGIATAIIAALKDAQTPPVYGFMNGIRLEDDPGSAPVLQQWRDAGFPLGNHTWSHMNLGQHGVAEWEADTQKNESVLAPLMAGGDWHWLRFPYLAEGETPAKHVAVRQFLAANGYRIAGVTMSFGDFMWNEPYARCVAKGNDAAIAQMEAAYLAAAADTLDYEHKLSLALYGRDIPYVLLMHLGAFDARMLPRLLALYAAKGVSFVSLDEAERDPFYAADNNPMLPPTPVTLEQAMSAQGVTYAGHGVPLPPFDTLCR